MILAKVQDKDLLDRLSIFEEAYSEEQRQLFKDRPDLYQKLIKASDQVFNDKYKVVRNSCTDFCLQRIGVNDDI